MHRRDLARASGRRFMERIKEVASVVRSSGTAPMRALA